MTARATRNLLSTLLAVGGAVWLVIRVPQAAGYVVLALGTAWVALDRLARGPRGPRVRRVVLRAAEVASADRHARVVEALRARDPDFEEGPFLARVAVAYEKVNRGLATHDPARYRPFVSDGVHEGLSLRIAERRDLGVRDHLERLVVRGATFAQLAEGGAFDAVTVRIEAVVTRWRVTLEDDRYVSGSTDPAPVVEYAAFLRRRGARTKPGTAGPVAGLIEGSCPNCGAPVGANAGSECAHCRALLRSGDRDWVLAEIAEAVEWREAVPVALPGFAALRERDPALDVQHLEDRAAVAFWRLAAAERLGDSRPLRRVATASFVRTLDTGNSARRAELDRRRRWDGERSIRDVETLGLSQEEGRDTAYVEVRWTGRPFTQGRGEAPQATGGPRYAKTLLAFVRERGVLSRVERAVSSAHCPGCGAPELGGDSGSCASCGAVLADGSRDWVLDRAIEGEDPERDEILADLRRADPTALATPTGPWTRVEDGEALLAWMAKAAAADGDVAGPERTALAAVARKAGLSEGRIDEMLLLAKDPEWAVPWPRDPAAAHGWLARLAHLAAADGDVSGAELALLERLGARHGLRPRRVRLLVAAARRMAYLTAKVGLRRAAADAGRPGGRAR